MFVQVMRFKERLTRRLITGDTRKQVHRERGKFVTNVKEQ